MVLFRPRDVNLSYRDVFRSAFKFDSSGSNFVLFEPRVLALARVVAASKLAGLGWRNIRKNPARGFEHERPVEKRHDGVTASKPD